MLLYLLYAALIALIGWSVGYLLYRIVRAFRGQGGCRCGCGKCGGCHCDSCAQKDSCKK